MAAQTNLALFPEERPAALVVSHERSGTHFLMNSLASCYEYVSVPWLDVEDATLQVQTYYPALLAQALLHVASWPVANTLKSHHPVDFFTGQLANLTRRYVMFVVHRDPVAVMLSFWRFMYRWPADGLRVTDPLTFARAEPCGRLLRYQYRQHPTLLHRWVAHVDGWLAAAQSNSRVVPVRYEDLDQCFERTMQGFANVLGRPPHALVRPPRDVNVIPGGPLDPSGSGIPPDTAALRQLCRDTVGATMERLGY